MHKILYYVVSLYFILVRNDCIFASIKRGNEHLLRRLLKV